MSKQDNTIEDLLQPLRKVTLDRDKKAAIRSNLKKHIEKHTAQPSPWVSFASPVLTVAATFLLLATGIGYSAEQARPGDALYPIKTNINEKVFKDVLQNKSFPEEQAELTDRRINELESLAKDNQLTASTSKDLLATIETYTKKAIDWSQKRTTSTLSERKQIASLLTEKSHELEKLADREVVQASTTNQAAKKLDNLAASIHTSSTTSAPTTESATTSSSSTTTDSVGSSTPDMVSPKKKVANQLAVVIKSFTTPESLPTSTKKQAKTSSSTINKLSHITKRLQAKDYESAQKSLASIVERLQALESVSTTTDTAATTSSTTQTSHPAKPETTPKRVRCRFSVTTVWLTKARKQKVVKSGRFGVMILRPLLLS
jgi:hypothetical protein